MEIFDSVPFVQRIEDFVLSLLKIVRAFLAFLGMELPTE